MAASYPLPRMAASRQLFQDREGPVMAEQRRNLRSKPAVGRGLCKLASARCGTIPEAKTPMLLELLWDLI